VVSPRWFRSSGVLADRGRDFFDCGRGSSDRWRGFATASLAMVALPIVTPPTSDLGGHLTALRNSAQKTGKYED